MRADEAPGNRDHRQEPGAVRGRNSAANRLTGKRQIKRSYQQSFRKTVMGLNKGKGRTSDMTIHYAEQIDVVFDSFINAIEGNFKARNLREAIMEINGDAKGWARHFAAKCQAELENMEDSEE